MWLLCGYLIARARAAQGQAAVTALGQRIHAATMHLRAAPFPNGTNKMRAYSSALPSTNRTCATVDSCLLLIVYRCISCLPHDIESSGLSVAHLRSSFFQPQARRLQQPLLLGQRRHPHAIVTRHHRCRCRRPTLRSPTPEQPKRFRHRPVPDPGRTCIALHSTLLMSHSRVSVLISIA